MSKDKIKFIELAKTLTLDQLKEEYANLKHENKELYNKVEYLGEVNRQYNQYCDELIDRINSLTAHNLTQEKWKRIRQNDK